MSTNSDGKDVQATAKVTVTLEIDAGGGAWGHDCTLGQLHKQALDGARNRLDGILQKERGIRIVGDLAVVAVTYPTGRGRA